METNTAKNFALQLGALLALYVSLTTLLVVLFGIINISFPDALDTIWEYESAQSGIRFGIAMLIVFAPTYFALTRMVNKTRRNEQGAYMTLTKWLIYLSLLLGGGVILGDLVAIINAFLNGEITERFVLKALAVLIVIGGALYYYARDAKGYWNSRERQSIYFGAGAAIVVLATLVYGFLNIETPSVVREMRLDAEQVSDLQDMEWRIEEFYRLNNALPETVTELYVGIPVPQAPEERPAYVYEVTGDTTYELCATFTNASDRTAEMTEARPVPEREFFAYTWDHPSGYYCFNRTIQQLADPKLGM